MYVILRNFLKLNTKYSYCCFLFFHILFPDRLCRIRLKLILICWRKSMTWNAKISDEHDSACLRHVWYEYHGKENLFKHTHNQRRSNVLTVFRIVLCPFLPWLYVVLTSTNQSQTFARQDLHNRQYSYIVFDRVNPLPRSLSYHICFHCKNQ